MADGAYAAQALLADLDERVTFVGRLRGDAAVYDPRLPQAKPGRRGRKAQKGPRLPNPKAAAAKADRKRVATGDWVWQAVTVTVYGEQRVLRAFAYRAVWPRVLGLRPVQVVVVRDPDGKLDDAYLFTTDVRADVGWVITQFAWAGPLRYCSGRANRCWTSRRHNTTVGKRWRRWRRGCGRCRAS